MRSAHEPRVNFEFTSVGLGWVISDSGQLLLSSSRIIIRFNNNHLGRVMKGRANLGFGSDH
ncbi:hypothetical protein KSS87_001883 [Heliosperma pusillum]|nr:hypothetical protein KSS87_001883 [Heliosperma pusillum]